MSKVELTPHFKAASPLRRIRQSRLILVPLGIGLAVLALIDPGIALAVAGVIFIGIVTWRWEYGVFTLVVLIPFENAFVFSGFRDGLKVLTIFTVTSMLLAAYRRTSVRESLQRVLTSKTFLLAVSFVLWAGLSVFWAYEPSVAISRITTFIGLVLLSGLIAMLNSAHVRTIWTLLVYSGVLSVVYNIAQNGVVNLGQRFVGAREDPNELAGLLLIITAVLLYGLKNVPFRAILAFVLVLGAILTQSRTGLIALGIAPLAAALVFVSIRQGAILGRTVVLYVLGSALALMVISAVPQLQDSLNTRFNTLSNLDNADTWAGRLGIWQGGLQIFKEHLVLGVGAGNFAVLSPNYSQEAAYLDSVRPGGAVAHNTYLGVAAELGIPGVLIFIAIIWRMFGNALRLVGSASLANALVFALAIYLVMSMTLTWEGNKILYLIFGTLLSMSIDASRKN